MMPFNIEGKRMVNSLLRRAGLRAYTSIASPSFSFVSFYMKELRMVTEGRL